jgi:hypothetical protein
MTTQVFVLLNNRKRVFLFPVCGKMFQLMVMFSLVFKEYFYFNCIILSEAIDLLENKLLVVTNKSRCTVETILKHDWFQKDKLFIDILQFLQKN